MIRTALTFLAAAFASSPSFAAAHLLPADRTALEQLKQANDAAWGRKDVETIAAQYAGDGTLRVAPGAKIQSGKEAVRAFFEKSFAARDGEYRHVTSIAELDALDENTVLSEGDVRVEKREADGRWTLARRFRTLTVAVRDGGAWKLRSVRAIPLN